MAAFLSYNPSVNVNYIFILMCNSIIDSQKDKTINYNSIKKLNNLFNCHFD
jgi:hypothetical protein